MNTVRLRISPASSSRFATRVRLCPLSMVKGTCAVLLSSGGAMNSPYTLFHTLNRMPATTSTVPKPIRIGRMMRHSALYQYGPYRRSSRMLS